MGFTGGERAVSEVMGAILVFGILVTALGVYQAVVVPDVNEEVEFKHNAEVRGDMQDLWAAMVETSRTGERNLVAINTGVEYPTRAFTINPPPMSGRISTTEFHSSALRIDGIDASNPEAADYWNRPSPRTVFGTRFVEYAPEYNYYTNAPTTIYEPTILYSSDRGGTVVDSPQRLIDGNTVNVVLVEGTYAKSTGTKLTLDTVPISTSGPGIETAGPLTLTVKTELPEQSWQDHIDKYNHAKILSYDSDRTGLNTVEIELSSGGGPYTLNIAKVGLDEDATTAPSYIINTDSKTRHLNPGENTDFTVTVLDKYGNPVRGVQVQCCGGRSTMTTDEDGTATFEYTAGPAGSGGQVNVWFGGGSPRSDEKTVEYSVTVSSPTTTSPGANVLNPGAGLVFQSASVKSFGSSSVDVRFRNENPSPDWKNVSQLRVNYYYTSPAGTGNSGTRTVDEFETNRTAATGEIGGSYISLDGGFNVSAGDPIGIEFEFIGSTGPSGSFVVDEGDYFFVSFIFEDGSSRIYIVTPKS